MRGTRRGTLLLVLALTGGIALAKPASAEDQRGRGSIGGNLGLMRFTGGGDMRTGVSPRPMGEIAFGYVWRTHTQVVSHLGFAWNGYNTCSVTQGQCGGWSELLDRGWQNDASKFGIDPTRPAVVRTMYATAEVQRNFGIGKYQPHANLGIGLYGWRAGSTRQTLYDPVSRNAVSGTSPGVNAAIGVEDYVLTRVALDASAAGHFVFSSDKTRLPSGFNQNAHFVELRLGVRWYFGLGAGQGGLPPVAGGSP